MLPYEINGLPLHILLVHFVVIVIPAGALMTALGSVWPAFRRKLGILTPIVTLLGLLSVPLATNAGEWLEARVGSTPLIQAHVALGDTLLPWAVGQFLLALVIWGWYRFFAAQRTVPEGPAPRMTSAPAPVPVAAGGIAGTRVADGSAAPASVGAASAHPSPSVAANPTTASSSAAGRTAAPVPTAHPERRERRRASLAVSLVVTIVLMVLGLGVSAGTVVKIVQIGESGSSAVWQGSFSENPTSSS